MADPKLKIVVTAEDKATKTIQDRLKKVGEAAMTGLKVVAAGVAAIGTQINRYQDYAQSVRQFATATGVSAEEASRLIQVADDLGVSSQTLERAMTQMARDGISFTYDELVKLSGEFKAIEDPAARGKLAMEKFGRAGLDMMLVMDAGPEKLKELGESAQNILTDEDIERSEKMRIAMDNFADTLDSVVFAAIENLLPIVTEFFNLLTSGIDTLNLLVTGEEKIRKEWEKNNKVFATTIENYDDYVRYSQEWAFQVWKSAEGVWDLTGKLKILSEEEYNHLMMLKDIAPITDEGQAYMRQMADQADRLVESFTKAPAAIEPMIEPQEWEKNNEVFATTIENYDDYVRYSQEWAVQVDKSAEGVWDLTGKLKILSEEEYNHLMMLKDIASITDEGQAYMRQMADQADRLVESFTKAPAAIEPMIEPLARAGLTAELVKDSFGELTDEMLFQQATAGLSPQAFLDVARAMGKVDEATYMQLKAAQDLNAQYLAGQVTIGEFTGKLADMDRWLRTIPKEIQTTVAVAVVTTGNVGQLPGNPTGGQTYQYGGSYAEGGDFWVERPTMIMVGERGRERVTVTPEGKGGGSVVIEQVVIQDEMTLARFEGMLKRVLKGVAR